MTNNPMPVIPFKTSENEQPLWKLEFHTFLEAGGDRCWLYETRLDKIRLHKSIGALCDSNLVLNKIMSACMVTLIVYYW